MKYNMLDKRDMAQLRHDVNKAGMNDPVAPTQPPIDELKELLGKIKWHSIDKDNMEFGAKASCYLLERIRKVLEEV